MKDRNSSQNYVEKGQNLAARRLKQGKKMESYDKNDTQLTFEVAQSFSSQPWFQSNFLKATRLEPVDRIPVWLMRQAGRYMSEYMDIRNKISFLDLCRRPDLCSEVMCTAVEKLNVDAAIIFSDLLPILQPMGFDLEFGPGMGPIIHNPVREPSDLSRVKKLTEIECLDFVFQTVKQTRTDLPDNIPVIGFAGSPFTLASYCIEGGSSKNYSHTKKMMYTQPEAWAQLMDTLSHSVALYLNAQIRQGAACVQLFDSWVGCLNPEDYTQHVLPYVQRIIASIPDNVPVINFGTGNPELLPLYRKADPQVVGIDWRIDIEKARNIVGNDVAIQGNMDPMVLLTDHSTIEKKAHTILQKVARQPGFIFNLGHGIVPQTPVQNAIDLVKIVHDFPVN